MESPLLGASARNAEGQVGYADEPSRLRRGPGGPERNPYESPATDETYAATSWICVSMSWPSNGGIAPLPFVTRSTTSEAGGFAWSRFGPTVPVEPASASVWHAVAPRRWRNLLARRRVPVRGRLGRRAAGLGRRLVPTLRPPRPRAPPPRPPASRSPRRRRSSGETKRRAETRMYASSRRGKPRAALRHEDRGDDRPRDERDRDDEQHRLTEPRDGRDQHRADATTLPSDERSGSKRPRK